MLKTELQVLNSVCKENDVITVLDLGKDEFFEGWGDVWNFIKDYHAKHRGAPPLEVVQEKFPKFEEIEVPARTSYYLEKLENEWIRRQLEDVATRMKEGLLDPNIDVREALRKTINSFAKIQQEAAGTKDTNIMDFDKAQKDYAETRRKAAENGGVPGIMTGIDFIDASYTTGLQPGDMVVVLGYPARGKTLLTGMISANLFKRGGRPMMVSLEMSAEKMRDRVYTMLGEGKFRNSDLSLGEYNEDDFNHWSGKQPNQEFVVVTHHGGSEVTPSLIQAKIDQHKPDLVVVDYAQLLSDNAGSMDMVSRMRNMSKEFKRMAMANQVPIVLISSATPESSSAANRPPSLESVAWSKQLAYDADLAFSVHKHDGTDIIEVMCGKNRNGPLFVGFIKGDIDRGIYKTAANLEQLM